LNKSDREKDAELPIWGPPEDVWLKVVPIWCGASHEELEERRGEEYASGFAAGFENGLITSMIVPEWAQGFYFKLREYYLTTHTTEDLEDWARVSEETARAVPVAVQQRRYQW
jgi:hypothetical protein